MSKTTDDLPGVEGEGVAPKKIKRLDNAIGRWRDYVDQRMALTENEVKARDTVISIMHEENLTRYPYWVDDDTQKELVLDSTEKLKLKKIEEAESGAVEPDGEDE